jgi:predicted RNA binding protein YcfA (HicA-like mRNA interferase family)
MKHHVNVRRFQRFLQSLGFKKIRQRGSHAIYSNGIKTQSLRIEKGSYSQGHLKKILKDFCLSIESLELFLYGKK